MTHYLLAVHTGTDQPRGARSEDDMRHYAERIGALESDMRSAGALVFSGRLDEPAAAAVIDATNGKPTTTDGPFLEAKEAIAGFYVIEAPGRDAALEWAAKTSSVVGMPIEVRPFAGFHAEATAGQSISR
jgi:hypothetical protein